MNARRLARYYAGLATQLRRRLGVDAYRRIVDDVTDSPGVFALNVDAFGRRIDTITDESILR